MLWIDDGDTATGGSGSDAFVTYANTYDPIYAPITITDFNRNEDTIEIGVFGWPLIASIDQNRLDTQMDFDARQTLIYVDDDVFMLMMTLLQNWMGCLWGLMIVSRLLTETRWGSTVLIMSR